VSWFNWKIGANGACYALGELMNIKRKILIVDDDEDLQDMVRGLLEHYDFECYSAFSVDEGLSINKQHLFDLVLLDLHFDESDGRNFLEHLRADAELTGTLPPPVMVMSTDRERSVIESVLKIGAKGFVAKPLQPLRFVKSVYEYAN